MRFSIITASYNGAATIRRTMDSILKQNFQDYEYIVIDGGSTDGTIEILREYEVKFQGRMRWISEPDHGIYDAMNKGLAMAKGDFVHFLQTDDYYFDDALANMSAQMNANPGYSVYYGKIQGFYEDGTISGFAQADYQKLPYDNPNHQSLFVDRNMFAKYGEFDTAYTIIADVKHMLQMFRAGEKFLPVDVNVAHFSMGGVSSKHKDILIREHHFLQMEFGYLDRFAWMRYVIRKNITRIVNKILFRKK